MSQDDGHTLVRINKRGCKKYREMDGETAPTVKRPHLDVLLHASNFEVDSDEKVALWLQANAEWREQPVWIPSEHPSNQRYDPFVHTYELGDDNAHPIEVEDDGWFSVREVVTDAGVYTVRRTWNELSDHEKRYWQEEWWYEKPWDLLVDPGAMSEELDDL